MRVAVFSDVHGNWTALQETWSALAREESLRRLPFLVDAYAWARERLSPESLAFLRGLPLTARFPGAGDAGDLVVCHASPHDVWPICHPDGSDELGGAGGGGDGGVESRWVTTSAVRV
jgi:hypothetical protein